MPTIADIAALVVESTGCSPSKIEEATDIYRDLGVDGDDFFDLMAKFGRRFEVDMASYRWYFHHGEEGFTTLGRMIFKPPNQRVERIAITPGLLLQSANAGRWLLVYPDHSLPSRRLDITFDRWLLGTFGALGLAALLLKWVRQ